MFDNFINWLFDRVVTDQRHIAHHTAEWLVTLIERIPEPARRYIPLKYERPDDYHTVEPELLQVQERPWHE